MGRIPIDLDKGQKVNVRDASEVELELEEARNGSATLRVTCVSAPGARWIHTIEDDTHFLTPDLAGAHTDR